jgi:hypothetical protein
VYSDALLSGNPKKASHSMRDGESFPKWRSVRRPDSRATTLMSFKRLDLLGLHEMSFSDLGSFGSFGIQTALSDRRYVL